MPNKPMLDGAATWHHNSGRMFEIVGETNGFGRRLSAN